MRALLKENVIEALLGALVLIVAALFINFAWERTQAGRGGGGYTLLARFPSVAGISPGTDVRLAGIKVGQVVAQRLDPASYQAVLEIGIQPGLNLPIDSSAAITSEGLLGGNFIALSPGAEETMLKPGEESIETSGAADLMALIGSVVNRSGGDEPKPADAPEQ
ncbi:outer membrane lipid asymmetry maintenance protein MlaD [Polymorphobacter multimanifer]|uniref:outer membrane lipid asymmetry maintenance protein MlaD n=1 Tax=Polymorphobacter multimanifer TaxID=1070431 RepID=UPI001669886B|nr:outer membrane lipid asymmetry maintenance protein MlaD [Polymorphobacter multimanifer]GGI70010.1 outer membrane lipid asymmetry maintenance protein MlaD [Polymorphobacter multimanifer]